MGLLRTDVIAHSQLTSANASVLFDGSGSSGGSTGLRTADGNYGYALGNSSESITIECWINCTSVSQTFDAIFATNTYGVSGVGLILYNNNDGLYMSGTGMESDYAEYGILEADTWYHVAFVKEKSQIRLYLDGVCKAYRVTTSDFSEDQLCIGCSNYGSGFPTYSFAGYISNFRITKRALYKADKFTVPKFKLKNISGTTLLCCQDASDDTTAAVGSISAGGTPVPGGLGPDLKEDNTDTGVVLADNTKFDTLSYMVPPGGTTTESNRGRGLIAGHYNTPQINTISYINIQSEGNSINFGDLVSGAASAGCFASSTRGVWCGGYYGPAGTVTDTIQYVTIATTGNAIDSTGNLLAARKMNAGLSNDTRGVTAGGTAPASADNVMQYVTIASLGNASDFGDLTAAAFYPSAAGNTTRGIIYLGSPAPNTASNVIDYITIATTGNASDFGDATYSAQYRGGLAVSNSTRLVNAGGYDGPLNTNIIDYVTIASTGNATDFGDLTRPMHGGANMSNSIRGVFAGAYGTSPAQYSNTMEYVTIATLGNGTAFGEIPNISGNSTYAAGCADSHGGIS